MKSRGLIIGMTIISIAVLTFFLLNRADYHGKVGDITDNNFTLYPLEVNPEYEHFTPKVHISNFTKITGKINNMRSLKEGQEVEIWAVEKEGKIVAKKIKVLKDS
ncbi:MAG: cold shock domain-containing protein [Psychrobacillus sp.]|uniref:cold shock domain-containing protein n=1 Tax=Psychrobacillus sp. MER TA 171 TaxID=2939577 RepID=UPI002041D5F1|nr:cold shock domain-containing protein [Psychrobacillus sp. MER TA 171]MCM3356391.1 cold shock domain-containing protein [Psychrobacillus sp. MER TA 171]